MLRLGLEACQQYGSDFGIADDLIMAAMHIECRCISAVAYDYGSAVSERNKTYSYPRVGVRRMGVFGKPNVLKIG